MHDDQACLTFHISLSFIPFPGTSASPAHAPQPVCSGIPRVQTLGVGETSSASEPFSSVSFPFKLIQGSKGAGPCGYETLEIFVYEAP